MEFGLNAHADLLWDPFLAADFFTLLLGIGVLGVAGLAVTACLLLTLRGFFLLMSSLFDRFTSEAEGIFESCQYALSELAGSHGGSFYQPSSSRLVYSPQRNMRLTVRRSADTILSIRVYDNFPFRGIFVPLPKILHSLFPRYPYVILTRNPLLRDLTQRSGFQSLTRFLYQSGFALRFDGHGLQIKKRLKTGEVFEHTFLNLLRIAADLSAIASTYVSIRIEYLRGKVQCAFCKEALSEGAGIVVCFSCGTPHHRDCFELNGSCSLFGCVSTRIVTLQHERVAYLQ